MPLVPPCLPRHEIQREQSALERDAACLTRILQVPKAQLDRLPRFDPAFADHYRPPPERLPHEISAPRAGATTCNPELGPGQRDAKHSKGKSIPLRFCQIP